MVHHNLQCLKNKIEATEIFLYQEHVDVLCVSETWVQPQEMDFIRIPNYNISSHYCRKSFSHGGTMILTKNSLISNEVVQIVNLSVDKAFECSAVEIKINHILYCIICVYKTPDSDTNVFMSKLEEVFNILISKNYFPHIIVCGDFNINFLSNCTDTLNLKDLVNSYCLHSVFEEPTRTTNKGGSAIDYILTNLDMKILHKRILNSGLSDHSGQKIIIDMNTPQKIDSYTFRSFSKNNISNFKETLNTVTWYEVYKSQTVEMKFTAFHNLLHYHYDKCFKFVSKNLNLENEKNWITVGIKVSSVHLKELYTLEKNGIIHKEYYNKYKNIYNRVIRQAKKMYFDDIIKNSANISKTVWKVINQSIKNDCNHSKLGKGFEIEIKNQLVANKSIIANEFNSFFINLPKFLAKSESNINVSAPSEIDQSIYLEPVTISEMIATINSLKETNSVGPDDISVKIIKLCAHQLAEPLTHIINECFREGTFPSFLKLSKVIPLYKKGDHKEISNYRPISILSVFSKIFEKILAKRLKTFLDNCNILSPSQHGFREGRSTISALINILDFIYKNLDQGNKVAALFIDLSKAFDCVDHDVLLKKIECYGLRGKCSKLLKSYLANRKQFVDFLGTRSKELTVDIGVPQGSVLGPLLFILYTNDLVNSLSTFYTAFADDVSIIVSDKQIEKLTDKLNTNLLCLNQYFENSKLTMNQDKTFIMQFHPVSKKYISSLLIRYKSKSIQQVISHKVLGIHLDLSLDWKSHVSYVCKNCASNCFALKRLHYISSINTVKMFYFSNLESRIRYGIIFWGYSTSVNRVFVLQKRAIRCMFGLRFRESCKTMFIQHKILTLPCLFIYETLKFVKENLDKFNFQNTFHDYPTRHGSDLQYDVHRLQLYKSNPYYIGSVLYNKLKDNVKNIQSTKKFLSTVKSFLVSNAFYSVEEFLN